MLTKRYIVVLRISSRARWRGDAGAIAGLERRTAEGEVPSSPDPSITISPLANLSTPSRFAATRLATPVHPSRGPVVWVQGADAVQWRRGAPRFVTDSRDGFACGSRRHTCASDWRHPRRDGAGPRGAAAVRAGDSSFRSRGKLHRGRVRTRECQDSKPKEGTRRRGP